MILVSKLPLNIIFLLGMVVGSVLTCGRYSAGLRSP